MQQEKLKKASVPVAPGTEEPLIRFTDPRELLEEPSATSSVRWKAPLVST